jgi:hypothetical protein
MTDGLPGIRRNRDFRESAVYYSDRRRFGRVLHCCAASIDNRRAKRQREPGKPRRRTDQPFDSSCGRTSVSSYPNPSHQIHGGRLAQTFSVEAHLTLRRAFQRNLARRATNVCRPSPTCVEASASMPKSLEMPAAYPAFEPGGSSRRSWGRGKGTIHPFASAKRFLAPSAAATRLKAKTRYLTASIMDRARGARMRR